MGGSGGFFGTGGSESSQETNKTTKITTKTDTDIRDIGLTGKDAVAYEALQTDTLKTLIQQTGENYNKLVGGANQLTKTAQKQANRTLTQATDLGKMGVQKASGDIEWNKIMPWVAVLATVVLYVGRQ